MEGTEIRKMVALEQGHWWYRERRHLIRRAIDGMRPGVALDVGAGGGGNTRVLVEQGWDAIVAEYGVEGAEVAHERGLETVRSDATALPVADASVDLVLSFDVLEHIVDDAAAASETFRVLRPGGTFLVAVPCDPALWSAHDEAVDHVRRYTRTTLTDLLQGAGFTIDVMFSWNVLLRPVVKLRRRSTTESDIVEVNPVVNLGLRSIITAERYLPLRNRAGVSLMVRAHKP